MKMIISASYNAELKDNAVRECLDKIKEEAKKSVIYSTKIYISLDLATLSTKAWVWLNTKQILDADCAYLDAQYDSVNLPTIENVIQCGEAS